MFLIHRNVKQALVSVLCVGLLSGAVFLGRETALWLRDRQAKEASLAKTDALAHIVDLGEVAPGEKITRLIRIPNKTKKSLTIKSIAKDCVCLIDDVKKETAMPGDFFEIAVSLQTQKIRGKFSHNLYLDLEETEAKYTVFLNGEVGGWCRVEPEHLHLSEFLGEEKKTEVTVATYADCPPHEFTVALSNKLFVWEYKSYSAKKKTIKIALDPKQIIKAGLYSGEIEFAWKKRGFKYILPVTVEVFSPYKITPDHILFDVDCGNNRTIALDVKKTLHEQSGDLPEEVSIRSVNLPKFVATALKVVDENHLRVIVDLHCGQCAKPIFVDGRIDLVSLRRKQVLAAIPVIGRIR